MKILLALSLLALPLLGQTPVLRCSDITVELLNGQTEARCSADSLPICPSASVTNVKRPLRSSGTIQLTFTTNKDFDAFTYKRDGTLTLTYAGCGTVTVTR